MGRLFRAPLTAGVVAFGLLLPAMAVAQAPSPPPAQAPIQQPVQQSAPTTAMPPAPAPTTAAPPTVTTTTPPTGAPGTAPATTDASPVSQPTASEPAPPPASAPAATPTPEPMHAAGPDALHLPRDLSPLGMFMAADIVVKGVMLGLVFASVLSWTIWFAKAIELMSARARMARAIDALNQARTWSEVTQRLQGRRNAAGALVDATSTELQLSADSLSPDGVKERVASRLERLEAAASRAMIRGTGVLATIGATAPFVGLFGTVWGIMNSFIGISKAQTTNLAVVAPGIAEALLATALGLVAAIPAVVMYNMFSRWTAGYRAQHADASAAILRIVSRDLDRGAFARAARRAVAAE
nr:tonB-system energizer ExbB [Pseudolabrys taiwanensis]